MSFAGVIQLVLPMRLLTNPRFTAAMSVILKTIKTVDSDC